MPKPIWRATVLWTDWCTWDEDYNVHIVEEIRKGLVQLATRKTDEYTEVDGNVAYAVLPVSEEGIREGVRRAISGEYTFWYSSTISFTASNSEEFTPQEEKEVIAILSSFRIA